MPIDRRSLLIGAGLGWPRLFGQTGFPPKYREQTSLDSALLKTAASLDRFPSKAFHDRIAIVLASWRERLLLRDIATARHSLGPGFLGSSISPTHETQIRTGAIEVWRGAFEPAPPLFAGPFQDDFRAVIESFGRVSTAELQVTASME